MKCIIGLGNPGKKYTHTRHNIGFMVMDELSRRHGIHFNKEKFKCHYQNTFFQQEKVLFVKPQTFMNLSGEGVKPLLDYYKVKLEDVLIIYDDLDLPIGKIRLRKKGGHGGHNGLRSLIDHFGTREFKRMRIGIGRPTDHTPIIQYVLQPFHKSDQEDVANVIDLSANACEEWIKTTFNDVMNKYNQ